MNPVRSEPLQVERLLVYIFRSALSARLMVFETAGWEGAEDSRQELLSEVMPVIEQGHFAGSV